MVGKAMTASSTDTPPGAAIGTPVYSRGDFHFELPARLIAQQPVGIRDRSRLLNASTRTFSDLRFDQIGTLLRPGDLLVVNNTRVVKARLRASKDSGGAAELLLERFETDFEAIFQVRVSKALKPGRRLILSDGSSLDVLERVDGFYRLRSAAPFTELLERLGEVPLPPYMERAAEAEDEERYQTVYSRHPGAAAAPTAGLHFTRPLLEALGEAGIETAEITLHVGAGTFTPVRSERLDQHLMHSERFLIEPRTLAAIAAAKARGGRVVAVGTTVVRALESAWRDGVPDQDAPARWTETDIFITPGFRFRVVDALVTNFHLPESTLLMLVSAFSGYDLIMSAYRHAVAAEYRFFTYGDAMFLECASGACP